MIRVMRPPTTASRKIVVCMRPVKVGTTPPPVPIGSLSGARALWVTELRLPVARPAQPLLDRTARPDLPAESTTSQVVGDLLGGDLQAEEGVHAGEVATQRGCSRGVDHSGGAGRAPPLESALDIKAADRVPSGTGMLERVGQDPVFGDVGFQTGAVDDEVGRDLPWALRGLDHADNHPVVAAPHLLDGARHHPAPAL